MNRKLFFYFFPFIFLSTICYSQVPDQSEPKSLGDSLYIKDSLETVEVAVKQSPNKRAYIPDTIYLKNGDKITGRIMSFEQGKLNMDGQGPGIIAIKWYKIAKINGGNRIFKVEDIYGLRYYGRINSSKEGTMDVIDTSTYMIKLDDLVRVFPLEAQWYRGIKGNIGAGFNYTKSSDVLVLNTEYNLYYVIEKWRFVNDFSYTETNTENSERSVRIDLNLQALYALPKKWVIYEKNSYSRNDELGIRSRLSLGVGGGNSIVQNERQRLILLTGISRNTEKNIESNTFDSNWEWPAGIQHTVFSFSKPNLTSSTSLTYYAGITEKGRERFDANIDFTWEFVTNFKLQLSFYYNYDNKELQGKNTTEDHGSVLSLLLQLK